MLVSPNNQSTMVNRKNINNKPLIQKMDNKLRFGISSQGRTENFLNDMAEHGIQLMEDKDSAHLSNMLRGLHVVKFMERCKETGKAIFTEAKMTGKNAKDALLKQIPDEGEIRVFVENPFDNYKCTKLYTAIEYDSTLKGGTFVP